MRGDYCEAVGIYRYDAAANPTIPVFSFTFYGRGGRFDFSAAAGDNVLHIVAKPKVAAYAVHAHRSSVKLVQVL